MAQKVQVLLLDDLSGGQADETVQFGIDGFSYEIDLSSANAEKLRAVLGPFIGAARRHSGRASATGRGHGRPTRSASAPETAKVRTWAKEQGLAISERGRVPKHVLEVYTKANA